jgi:U4/U6.U5 tri-snRNP component SNU23
MGSQRAFLKSRDEKVELDEKVGKVEIINPAAVVGNRAGYWCEVCQCLLKDSASYLDHINGKKRK